MKTWNRKCAVMVAVLSVACTAGAGPADEQNKGPETKDQPMHMQGAGHKASALIGMDVKNPQNDKLGRVDDMIVDLPSGRVSYLILSTGGILGIGDSLVAVPARKFSLSASADVGVDRYRGKHLVLDMAKSKLEGAPKFGKRDWPNMDSKWSSEIDTYYGVSGADREFVRGRASEATKDSKIATSDIAQRVKDALSMDASLSASARKIEVNADAGKVTLTGIVASDTEKQQMEAKAKGVAGVTSVDNKLEIRGK